MKLHDHICKSICDWPTLYLLDNFESSKIRVLDHLFGTLGNGVEWAHTKNPKQGGYMCEDRHRKVKGEYVRIFDKPYGKEKFEKDINKKYIEPIIEVYDWRCRKVIFVGTLEEYNNNPEKETWEDPENKEEEDFDICRFRVNKDIRNSNLKYHSTFVDTSLKFYGWHPYPYFGKDYSPLWEIEPEDIKDDWKEGALYWLKECKEFFLDDKRVKTYSHYPTKINIRDFKKYVLKEMETKTVDDINKMYGTTSFTGDNFEEVEMERWDNNLKNIMSFINETIERLS